MANLIAEQNHRLLLYAKSADFLIRSVDHLTGLLIDIDFIGDPCHGSGDDYLTGDRFTDHVTFLGCSPSIALSPQDGDNYCFIRIHEAGNVPVLYAGKNASAPYCPQCQQTKNDWQVCEQEDFCEQCNLIERAESWRWRKQGALSHWVIEIMNIYPHEAVPSPWLLDQIKAVSGVPWSYAYLHAC